MISIIIPVYNRAGMLERSVRSVMEQSLSDWELILVDDGSSDGSADICDGFVAADPRIRAFHKPNGGVSSARNLGLEHIGGDWLTFVDADDALYPDAIKIMVGKAEKDNLDVLQFAFNREYSAGENDGRESGVLAPGEYIGRGYFHGSACCTCIHSKIVKDNGIRFDTGLRIAEDHLFMYETLKHSKRVGRTGDVLYWYFDNAAGAFANTRPGDNIGIINKFGPYKNSFPEAARRIDTLLLGCLFNLAHKSDTDAGEIARLFKIADIHYCAPEKSLGVKLFWQLSRISPKLATFVIRVLRRVFPNRK